MRKTQKGVNNNNFRGFQDKTKSNPSQKNRHENSQDKKTLLNSGVSRLGGPQWKSKKTQVFDLFHRTKRVIEHESDGDTIYSRCTWRSEDKPGLAKL